MNVNVKWLETLKRNMTVFKHKSTHKTFTTCLLPTTPGFKNASKRVWILQVSKRVNTNVCKSYSWKCQNNVQEASILLDQKQ